MEMYSASDLKKGLKIEIDGYPWVITDFDFCKPGKGTALYRCSGIPGYCRKLAVLFRCVICRDRRA